MKLVKITLAAALVAGAGFSLSLASVASGPIILSPVTAPVTAPRIATATVQRGTQLQKQFLSAYRQVRTFWLSRGIVR
jgi:multisubunit Na+/H+ antiporter MnhG subunit